VPTNPAPLHFTRYRTSLIGLGSKMGGWLRSGSGSFHGTNYRRRLAGVAPAVLQRSLSGRTTPKRAAIWGEVSPVPVSPASTGRSVRADADSNNAVLLEAEPSHRPIVPHESSGEPFPSPGQCGVTGNGTRGVAVLPAEGRDGLDTGRPMAGSPLP
jgi:hypothetical protein